MIGLNSDGLALVGARAEEVGIPEGVDEMMMVGSPDGTDE